MLENWWDRDLEDLQSDRRESLREAAAELWERFDRERGGFRRLPEDQEGGVLLFLLEYARRAEDDWARAMAEVTLEERGGGCDPLLACAHLEAYAQTGRPNYREAACDILDHALKNLRLPGGCFALPGDETVSTQWNAQMIAALAKAYRVLGEAAYLRAAVDARLFLKNWLTQSNGQIWHRWRNGTPMEEGRLEDYGFCCWALTELYESDFSISCLREAEQLADRMTDIFRDHEGRFLDFHAASASRSGVVGLALSKLARLTNIERYRDMAREQQPASWEFPDGLALLGMVEELWPTWVLVCASAQKPPNWLALVGEEYRLTVMAKTGDNSWGLENAAPWLREFPVPESGNRLYLCRDGVCEASVENLLQLYQHLAPEGAAV
ncbi:MAG: hypothetical protein K2N78_01680 [Oscillospiraceae bacterium]|nr:hypothetical protein [Oscillospiraceae bacterium]